MTRSAPFLGPLDSAGPEHDPGVRTAALIAGIGLAALAVLAPIAFFVLLPAGQTTFAGYLFVLIAAIDVAVALSLVPVLRNGGELLAGAAGGLRTAYAALLALAAVQLLAQGDVTQFWQIFHPGQLVFAGHLLLVGLLSWRAPEVPRVLGPLVGIAGIGYVVDTVLALTGTVPPSPVTVVLSVVMVVGEVTLLLWLLLRGGRRATTGRPGAAPRNGRVA